MKHRLLNGKFMVPLQRLGEIGRCHVKVFASAKAFSNAFSCVSSNVSLFSTSINK